MYFLRFDGIGKQLFLGFWGKWNLEYKYISFFAPESESNYPLREMIVCPVLLSPNWVPGQPTTSSDIFIKLLQLMSTVECCSKSNFIFVEGKMNYY